MTNFEFMDAANEKLKSCWEKLNKDHGTNHSVPRLAFDLKGGAAGCSTEWGRLIRLNWAYVGKHASQMISEVIPHEVAHAWLTTTGHPSHTFRPRRPHGEAFMQTVRQLGGVPRASHNFEADIPPSPRSTYKYICPTCKHVYWLTVRKHNQIRRGVKCWCPVCGPVRGNIEYVR